MAIVHQRWNIESIFLLSVIFLQCLSSSMIVGHYFHESNLPRGWGDIENLTPKYSTSPKEKTSQQQQQQNNQQLYVVPSTLTRIHHYHSQTTQDPTETPETLELPTTTEELLKFNSTVDESQDNDDGDDEEDEFHDDGKGNGQSDITKLTPPVLTVPSEDKKKKPENSKVQESQKEDLVHQFVWKVYNFSDILCSGQELIFSPRFYLVEPGYRLQLLLVTNTTYSDNQSYLGVFFRIVAGDYDASLEWPYKFRTELSVIESTQLAAKKTTLEKQNTESGTPNIAEMIKIGKNRWTHTVIPNIDECRLRSAFLRPNSDIETGANTDGCGNRRHIPLTELEGDRLMQDDTLLVLITVYRYVDDTAADRSYSKAAMSMRYNEMVSNYWWTVDKFSVKQDESISTGRIVVLTSNPFYTHPNGYLLQLFLTILPKRNAFAVSIAFVQGDHDRYLQWPFPYPFEMAIVDQSPDYWKRDLTAKVKPSKSDCGTESFAQPNPTPEFCFLTIQSLQVLSLKHYNFLINDTLKIRFTTRFERYSQRQRSSIMMHNGRLVSEFNWLIPGIVARFERFINENSITVSGGGYGNGNGQHQSVSNSANRSYTSTRKKWHKFVSDEFYTNGQGYLCQLVLTVSVRNVPVLSNFTTTGNKNPKQDSTGNGTEYNLNENNSTGGSNDYQPNSSESDTNENLSQDVLVFGLELVIIEGEYDRFLEWPFNSSYELSIVGYKNGYPNRHQTEHRYPPPAGSTGGNSPAPENTTNDDEEDSSQTSNNLVGQLYSLQQGSGGVNETGPGEDDGEDQGRSQQSNNRGDLQTRTSSKLLIPTVQVNRGECHKESFQKPIERNPPCGIREFVHFGLSKRQAKSMAGNGSSGGVRNNDKMRDSIEPTDSRPGGNRITGGVPNSSNGGASNADTYNVFDLGTLTKSDEDLHLRVRIYL